MTTPTGTLPDRNRRGNRVALALIVALLSLIALPYYLTPQTPLLPHAMDSFLKRHAVERIVFVLPAIFATWALGWQGGVFALAMAVLIMLPRAIWISSSPPDALFETAAAAAIGSLAIWAIEAQARQAEFCRKTASRLGALNAVSEEITSVLDLDEVLHKVLEIAQEHVGADGGGIALFDPEGTSIHYPYLHNLPRELAEVSIRRGEGAAGEATTTGSPLLIEDYQSYPSAIPAFAAAGLVSVVSVPIVSGERAFGALTLVSLDKEKHFTPEDIELLTGIGRQAAAAIDNARLYQAMRGYARQVVQAQEEERQRIARELHDETIQMLIVISRRLELLAAAPEPLSEDTRQLLSATRELLHGAQAGIRRFMHGLHPSTLEHLGLVPAIRSLASNLGNAQGIEVAFELSGQTRRLDPGKELALYRITQEALNNVAKHAQATRVHVHLNFQEERLQITIQDNGRGFVIPQGWQDLVSLGRLGMIGMDERARSQGGTVVHQSEPGHGTTVRIEAPI